MMLRELYQQLIIDHGRHPRNFGALAAATHVQKGWNPLCGDKMTLYLQVQDAVIHSVRFEGSGCAISMASASLLTEALRGLSVDQAMQRFAVMHQMLLGQPLQDAAKEELGKLTALSGVVEFPARVKCATLAWQTLKVALEGVDPTAIATATVSTE